MALPSRTTLARQVPHPLEVVRVYGAPEIEGSTRTAGWRWDLVLSDRAGDDGAYLHLQQTLQNTFVSVLDCSVARKAGLKCVPFREMALVTKIKSTLSTWGAR